MPLRCVAPVLVDWTTDEHVLMGLLIGPLMNGLCGVHETDERHVSVQSWTWSKSFTYSRHRFKKKMDLDTFYHMFPIC